VLLRTAILASALLLAGCSNQPDTYAPPVQRKPLYVPTTSGSLGSFVAMSDSTAGAYIVRDISDTTEAGGWRWTHRHPQLRFFLPKTTGLKFSMDFAIPNRVMREVGAPITLAFSINGHPFDTLKLEQGGEQHYRKEVPAALLKANLTNIVSIEPDKVWTSKEDGAVLGFILSRAGFTE